VCFPIDTPVQASFSLEKVLLGKDAGVNNKKCDICGGKMIKNGRTKSGGVRWRCKNCGGSYTHRIDTSAKELKIFLRWLFSKKSQSELDMNSRTFRRMASKFWAIWPLAIFTGECLDVVIVDGIWIADNVVVLIATTYTSVIGWYVAKSECASAWAALISKIPPPKMVVTDGGTGFMKAARTIWPNTTIQRCLFHVFCQVKRETTSRPKLECSKELYKLAKQLMHAKNSELAAQWLANYAEWDSKWNSFLAEYTFDEKHKKQYTHEHLRKARRGLNKLIKDGVLFTFIEMQNTYGGFWPSTSNMIEGGVNAQLRALLRNHKGLPTIKRLKAVCWWCYMHSDAPKEASWILKNMPTDSDAEGLYRLVDSKAKKASEGPQEWGDGVAWSEFHTSTEFRQ
jgi:hypothetical protein